MHVYMGTHIYIYIYLEMSLHLQILLATVSWHGSPFTSNNCHFLWAGLNEAARHIIYLIPSHGVQHVLLTSTDGTLAGSQFAGWALP